MASAVDLTNQEGGAAVRKIFYITKLDLIRRVSLFSWCAECQFSTLTTSGPVEPSVHILSAFRRV